jgi:hypothetical protein
MAYASSNSGKGAKGASSEPSGGGSGGTYASKGDKGVKSEPGSSLKGGGMTTKGNAKKL